MATIPTTTYSTVRKVFELLGYYNEINGEAVGTGDGVTTTFYFDWKKVIQYSETVYVAAVAKTRDTDYTIDYDTATITFLAGKIPTAPQAITADYWYSDIFSSVVGQMLVRSEDEIDRNIGRTFKTSQSVSESLDGSANADTSFYSYQSTGALVDSQRYKTLDESFRTDRTVILTYYPVLNVNLVSTEIASDAQYLETNKDANSAWGGANWVAQSFLAGGSDYLVKAQLYLKYNTGTAADITVGVYANSGGKPTGSALGTATISALTDTSYAWRDANFTTPIQLTAGSTYHLVLSSASSGTSAYHLGVDSTSPTYTNGALNTSANSGSSWTTDTASDACFIVYLGTPIDSSDYVVYKDLGAIVFTQSGGKKNTKGIQNVYVAYTYGYASVPSTIELLSAKMAAVSALESRIMGDPSGNLEIRLHNIGILKNEINMHFNSMGRKLQVYQI